MRRIIVPLERMGARICRRRRTPAAHVEGSADLTAIEFLPDVAERAGQERGAFCGAPRRRHDPGDRTDVHARSQRTGARGVRRAGGTGWHGGGDSGWPAADRRHVSTSRATSRRRRSGWSRRRPSRVGDRDRARRSQPLSNRRPRRPDADGRARHAGDGARAGWRTDRHDRGAARRSRACRRSSQDEVPGVIDELPVLAALATHGGELTVSGAQELRVKESDRISALAEGLRAMGGGHRRTARRVLRARAATLRGGEVDARNDHRLAMAFAVAALGATGPTVIHDAAPRPCPTPSSSRCSSRFARECR